MDLFSMPFRQLLTKISNTTLNERSVVIVTAVLIFSMIMDMELSNLADILQKKISSPIGIFTFVVISGVYLSVQYLLLRYSKQITADLRSRKKEVNFIETIVSILQIVLIIRKSSFFFELIIQHWQKNLLKEFIKRRLNRILLSNCIPLRYG